MSASKSAKLRLRFYMLHLIPSVILTAAAIKWLSGPAIFLSGFYVLYWTVLTGMHFVNRKLGHWDQVE